MIKCSGEYVYDASCVQNYSSRKTLFPAIFEILPKNVVFVKCNLLIRNRDMLLN